MDFNHGLWVSEENSLTKEEDSAIRTIINKFNDNSFIELIPEKISINEFDYKYDSYHISSKDDKPFELKISFSERNPLSIEYNFLRCISDIKVAPVAVSMLDFEYMGQLGTILLKTNPIGFSLDDCGARSTMSEEENHNNFFSCLAKIQNHSPEKINRSETESNIISHIGDFEYYFSKDFIESVFKEIEIDKEILCFDELRKNLKPHAKILDFGKIINGKLDGGNIISSDGIRILQWDKAFLGNPLFDFMDFILKNRLHPISEKLKISYFSNIEEYDKNLSFEMRTCFNEYFNYFIDIQLWICMVEYLSIYASFLSGYDVKIKFIKFQRKFNDIKDGFRKNMPFCTDIIDKLDNIVNNKYV